MVGRASRTAVGAILSCSLVLASCDGGARAPVLDLPPRPSDAPGGAEIARDVRGLGVDAREERIYTEISRGNVPTWLRQLERVEVDGRVDGRARRVAFWATPDYLAVGSDADFLLVPLSPGVAQRIADLVGGSLPTPRMVDAIWEAAEARLAPQRIVPDEYIRTVRYFERHDRLVRGQRWLRHVPPGALVAGHKKDVVLSTALPANPGRVAIYGWHRTNGEPIQPLTTVLADTLVYYNHGVRLVDRDVFVDGARMDLPDVLSDPRLAPLLSDDGVVARARYVPRRE